MNFLSNRSNRTRLAAHVRVHLPLLTLHTLPLFSRSLRKERISAQGKRIAFVVVLLAALTGFLSFLLLAPRLPPQLGSEKPGEDLASKMTLLLGALPKASAFVSVGALSRVHMAPTTIIACSSLGHYRTGTTPPRTARTSFIRYLTGGSSTRFASGTGLTMQSAGKVSPKHVLVPVADGSEEIESVTIIDTLVRAGASVTVASVSENIQVTCSRGVKLVADCKLAECEPREWDAVVCPGGLPGATNLKESEPLKTILKKQADDGRIVAAICAAPAVVLASHGLLEGKKATCYPADAFTSQIPEHVDEQVVVDGNTITSQGPATAMIFALKLVESLFGMAKADEIGQAMLVP